MHENQRPQAKGEQVVRGRGRQTQHLQNPQEGEAVPPSALWLPPPRMGKQSQGHADRWQTQPAGAAPLLLGGLLDLQPSPEGDGRSGTAVDALDAAQHREDGSSAVQTRTGSWLEAGVPGAQP